MDLNDVTFDWTATVFVRGAPGQGDAALGLVFNLWGSWRAWRVCNIRAECNTSFYFFNFYHYM